MTIQDAPSACDVLHMSGQTINPPEDDWPRIGETLKTFRETRGYSPKEFADKVGISRSYLVNIEAGRKRLTDILLCKMAAELRIKQHAIMNPNAPTN